MRNSIHLLLICIIAIYTGCAGRQTADIASESQIKEKPGNEIINECLRLASSGDGKITGWKLVPPADIYDKETIFDYIDGAAELYFAYDFRAVAAAEYQNGETSIIVDVYDMTIPDGAFGIYSLNRYQGANYVDVGNEGILSGTALDFWKGQYLCKVYSLDMSEKYQIDVVSFGNALASEIKEAGTEPSVIDILPQNGLIPKSVKFFTRKLGLDNIHFISEENLFHLSEDTKGVVAEYELENSKFQIFLIQYSSLNEAVSAFKVYSEFLGKTSELLSTHNMTQETERLFKSNSKFTGICVKERYLCGFWDIDSKEMAELILQDFLP